MKKQNTHPSHALSLFSYTRSLTFFSSKFPRSLFLLLFAILFSQVSFAQVTINAASANNDLPVPGYFFSAGHIETSVCACSTSATGHAIGFVTDGNGSVYASFTPEWKAGLTVTDDNGHFDFFAFDQLNYFPGSVTSFRNPDVVLLRNGTKAIITFETDDPTYNSFILELDITITTLSSPYVHIYYNSAILTPVNTGAFASTPRIDGDNVLDRFAVVSIDNTANPNVPKYSIYEHNGSSYHIYNSIDNYTANANTITATAILPDISLGHLAGGGQEPECVVSYIHGDPTGFGTADLIVDYQDNTPSSSNQLTSTLASNSTTLFTSYDTYPNYPHICSEEEFTTTGTMQWALAESLVDPPNVGSLPNHMLYAHSDNPPTLFYLDAANTGNNSYLQGKGTLDWMSQDGFVAWRHEIASPNTQQIVGVMNPLPLTQPVNSWDQVYDNYNVATVTGTDWLQALSVGRSDDITNLYVVAELFIGKIIYKVRNINSTGFKPNNLSASDNKIYPIPCNDKLYVTTTDAELIVLKDIIGKTVCSTTIRKGLNIINTSSLADGNYFLIRGNNISNSLFTVSH